MLLDFPEAGMEIMTVYNIHEPMDRKYLCDFFMEVLDIFVDKQLVESNK